MTYPFLGDEAQAARLAGCTIAEIYDLVASADAVVRARLGRSNLDAATQGMIVEFLAAHYFTMGNGGAGGTAMQSERLGDYSVSYAAAADLSDLRSTRFGRIAVELDSTGALGEASKPRAAFAVL